MRGGGRIACICIAMHARASRLPTPALCSTHGVVPAPQGLADTKCVTDNFMKRMAVVEARERVNKKLLKEYGVSEYELRSAFKAIKERVTTHTNSSSHALTGAFRRLDTDHSGSLSAEEVTHWP